MKLEVGKNYRTVDGRETGPLKPFGSYFRAPKIAPMYCNGSGRVPNAVQLYNEDGSVERRRPGEENDTIVAEWPGSPVQEVTTRRIVPGKYGPLNVYQVNNDVRITFIKFGLTADEYREAARHLNDIADFLAS